MSRSAQKLAKRLRLLYTSSCYDFILALIWRPNVEQSTVWVAGASSGLGAATARAFADAGWLVVAGARSFAAPQPQEQAIIRLPLDVTDAQSVADFARQALSVSPQVDAMVYCAGLLVLGASEETDFEEYRRVMDTNFLGMTRMVNAALPLMRARGAGKLVLFSSINGLLGVPFQGAYTASKHAIEGYAECLAMECAPFGVRVSLVEPGDHRSGSQRYRLHAANARPDSPYEQEYRSACAAIHRDETGGLSPERLGAKVVRNAAKKRPRFRLRVAKPDQRLAVLLHTLLPQSAFSRILRGYYCQKGRA